MPGQRRAAAPAVPGSALAGLPRWALDPRKVKARVAVRRDGAYATVGLLVLTLTHLLDAGRAYADADLADAVAEHADALVEDLERSGVALPPPDPDVLLHDWPAPGAPGDAQEPPYAGLLHVCCASLCSLLSDHEDAVPLWLVGLDVRDASVALRWYARAVDCGTP